MRVLAAVLLAVVCGSARAHVCMLSPNQRGGANVTGPGNMACFQPQAPCGTKASGSPAITLQGGETASILIQQNLNHYAVGNPGFLDIAYHTFPEPSSDDGFTVLKVLPDYWAHLQAQQTNFTVPVLIPNIDCDHCVLRVRYHPNKPTEPIFHNCADVAIKSTATPAAEKGTLMVLAGAPPATSKLYWVTPVTYDADGEVATSAVTTSTSLPADDAFFADGLATYVPSMDTAFYVVGASTTAAVPSTLKSFGKHAATVAIKDAAGNALPGTINAIVPSGNASFPLLMVGRVGNASNFFFYQVRYLNLDGVATEPIAESTGQQTFVNFMWAANPDAKNGKLYFAAGDENSLFALNLVIFTVDLVAGTMGCVAQDNTAYTLSSIHLNPADGLLYTVSPGLFQKPSHTFQLVQVDPASGAVKAVGDVAKADQWRFEYSGGIYGAAVDDGHLVYMFTDPVTGSKAVAHIDLATAAVDDLTYLDDGINHQVAFISAMYIPPASSVAFSS